MLAAAGLASAGLAAASTSAAELARTYGAELDLQPVPLAWLAALVAGAAFLGGLIASLSSRWRLRQFRRSL